MDNKKALVISYFFPPVGGSGVQRILKYVKYLPEYGWDPTVLTVKPITYSVYDYTLVETVPESVNIVRTESLDPLRISKRLVDARRSKTVHQDNPKKVHSGFAQDSKFIQMYRNLRTMFAWPDVQIGWLPFALRSGINLVRNEEIDIIVARIPPYSNGVLAHLISQRTGIPYVLDFADAWLDDPYIKIPTFLHRWGHTALERRVVTNSQAVIACSDVIQQNFLKRYPSLENKTHVLYNGFDPDDFAYAPSAKTTSKKKEIVYIGSLYVHHEANFLTLVQAINLLPENLKDTLEITFVGQFFDKAAAICHENGLENVIKFSGYLPHQQAAEKLSSADASLLFVKPGDKESLTGKVFEYLTTTSPLIALIEPDGGLGNLLNMVGRGRWVVSPTDSAGLAQVFMLLAQEQWPRKASSNLELFDRNLNTGRLANILMGITEEADRQQDVAGSLAA